VAAAVAGLALLVGGLTLLVIGVDMLSCDDPFACRDEGGTGAALLFVSLPMAAIGVAGLVQAARRPVDDADGSNGWIVVLAAVALLGAVVWAVSIKTSWCPPGSRQLRLFAICWRPSGERFDPESRLTLKWLVGVSGVFVAAVLLWQGAIARRFGSWSRVLWGAAVVTAAALAAAGIGMVLIRVL